MSKRTAKARSGKAVWLKKPVLAKLERLMKPRESYDDTLARILKVRLTKGQ